MSVSSIELQKRDGIGTVRLARAKVNAINADMVAELHSAFRAWESDPDVRAVVPKPVVAAIGGHAIAGGCMLALACDYRVMAPGKARISLNEITFGASIFAISAEQLRFAVGSHNALISGSMHDADEALTLGLIDSASEDFMTPARELAAKPPAAYASMKSLLRKPIVDEYSRREMQSIREFVEIWYSPETWANLQGITIR